MLRDRLTMGSLKNYFYCRLDSLNLHRDLAFSKRWRYRKFFCKGNIRTLDVGGGGGPFTAQCLKNGNSVTLVDLDGAKIDKALKKLKALGFLDPARIKAVTGDIREYETEDKFEQILLLEVLEHIQNDQALLNKLASFLKPRGRLIISSPTDNFPSFYGEKVSCAEDGGHVRKGYSFRDIQEKIQRSGLKVIFMESYIGYFTQKGLAFSRYLSDHFTANLCLAVFLKILLLPFSWLDKLAHSYPDYCLFVIAQKDAQ